MRQRAGGRADFGRSIDAMLAAGRDAMPPDAFLERIFHGSIDPDVFQSFRVVQDEAKVDRLRKAYAAILDEYPAVSIEAAGAIPEKMLSRMGEIGLFGVTIPEEYGGLGFNVWEYMRLVEAMVKMDVSVAIASIAHCSIGVKGVQLFGNDAQKRKYLVPAATGEMIFSYALTEPRIGSDARHIETLAELSPDGSHYVLNGQKTYITNANYAGGLTVFARMDPGRPGFLGVFIVETGWEGVKVGKDMPKMGLKASSTAPVRFTNVRVPVENLLGKPGEGFKIAMTVLNYGRLGLGAASVGMMERSLRDMMKRSSTRVQFQVPIRDFPLIQEKLVSARVNAAVSKAMNDFAAHFLNANPRLNVAIETSHCKLFGTTRAWDTLYDALQVAGGSGYLSTQPYEKRMRDFRVATVFEGTTEIHSIYPALFLIRKTAKDALRGGRRTAALTFCLKALAARIDWKLRFDNRIMRRASRLAGANARTISRMIPALYLLYRDRLPEKEYLLRRISTLSLYLFGLVALLAGMSARSGSGPYGEEDLRVLAHFTEEAALARKASRRLFDSRKEILDGLICRDLFRGWKDERG